MPKPLSDVGSMVSRRDATRYPTLPTVQCLYYTFQCDSNIIIKANNRSTIVAWSATQSVGHGSFRRLKQLRSRIESRRRKHSAALVVHQDRVPVREVSSPV